MSINPITNILITSLLAEGFVQNLDITQLMHVKTAVVEFHLLRRGEQPLRYRLFFTAARLFCLPALPPNIRAPLAKGAEEMILLSAYEL